MIPLWRLVFRHQGSKRGGVETEPTRFHIPITERNKNPIIAFSYFYMAFHLHIFFFFPFSCLPFSSFFNVRDYKQKKNRNYNRVSTMINVLRREGYFIFDLRESKRKDMYNKWMRSCLTLRLELFILMWKGGWFWTVDNNLSVCWVYSTPTWKWIFMASSIWNYHFAASIFYVYFCYLRMGRIGGRKRDR